MAEQAGESPRPARPKTIDALSQGGFFAYFDQWQQYSARAHSLVLLMPKASLEMKNEKASIDHHSSQPTHHAWQVGTRPTITYTDKAKSRNKSNVPVGLYVGKTVKIGKIPLNIKAIVEYSVVSQDTWGKRAASRFEITPVIRSLITEPIFGK